MMLSVDLDDPFWDASLEMVAPDGEQHVLLNVVDNTYPAGGVTMRIRYHQILTLMEFFEDALRQMEEEHEPS